MVRPPELDIRDDAYLIEPVVFFEVVGSCRLRVERVDVNETVGGATVDGVAFLVVVVAGDVWLPHEMDNVGEFSGFAELGHVRVGRVDVQSWPVLTCRPLDL